MYNNDTLLLYSRDIAIHVFLGKDEPISPFRTEQLVILYFLLLIVCFLIFCVTEKKITILILVIPIKFIFFSFVKIFFYYIYLIYHPGIIEPLKVIAWLLPWTCTYYFANEPLLRLKFANISFDYARIIFLLYLRYGNRYWELSLHANRNIIFFLLITIVLIRILLYQRCIFFDKKNIVNYHQIKFLFIF